MVALVAGALLAGCGGSKGSGPERDATLPSSATVQVVFGLTRDDEGLADAVRETSDPASPSYGDFLSPDEVAERFGASVDDRDRVLEVLQDHDIEGEVTATGGAVVARLTAEQAHDLLGQWPQREEKADGAIVASLVRELEIPDELEGSVQEVIGGRSTIEPGDPVNVAGGVPAPTCTTQANVGQASAVGDWYGFDDYLYRDDVRGQDRRIAVLAIGGWEQASLDTFAECYGTRPSGRIRVQTPPGLPELPVGPEVTLDVIVASSFAPEAAIDVLTYDPNGTVASAFLDAFDSGAGDVPLDAVSTSIGYCETALEPAERAVTDHALLALAATGTTVLAASGDTGSASCLPDEELAVQYPASSPWVTGVGGTTIEAGTDAITGERAWSSPGATPLAGGGGSSATYPRPWFQRDLDPPGAVADRRLLPDVAYLADPEQVPAIPLCGAADECSWYRLAGTSAPAPALAAALSLAGQDLEQQGAPLDRFGLLAPLAGALATQADGGVHDVTEGSNRVLGLPCCDAGPGYDLTTGWGSLRLPELVDAAVAASD